MALEIWLSIAVGGALAAFVQGLSGFGFGLVALSVWSWVMEPALAVPVVVFGSLVGQLLAVGSLRDGFSGRRLFPFVVGGVLGVPTGIWLLRVFDPLLFKFGVGLLLAVFCSMRLFLAHLPAIHWGGRAADGIVGWVGGTMSGFGGLPGVVPTLWCTLRGWPRDQQRTTFQAFNLFMHIVTLTALLAHGMITRELVGPFLVLVPAILLPSLLGIRLFRRFSDSSFTSIVLVLLATSGFMLLVSTAPQVFRLLMG
ncbi:TSUP family transporter [Pusillimonas sp. TS35]|uniref:sulfite exporter TauE/SafE family protein n=1 Tax=Paracandidimonas lactea TaxID=2895524 RepID=UPI0013692A03|nr:sulfite exporter TauE/SafE family protein [Paracandidimonas lactea]MYN12351.1 TSUP family transporter [Pusillimonas sp. TS35]